MKIRLINYEISQEYFLSFKTIASQLVNRNVILSESDWFLNKPVEQDKPIKHFTCLYYTTHIHTLGLRQ